MCTSFLNNKFEIFRSRSMTFGGDASASESEVRGKCVSAMCLVRFASSDFCTLAHSLWLHSLTVGLQINCKSARDARWEIPG